MVSKFVDVVDYLFNEEIDQNSPVFGDVERKVSYDEDGKEIVTYEKVDYPALVKSNGKVDDWKLNNLLKAGIDPAFSIHTANYNSRLEGIDDVKQIEADVNALFAEAEAETPKTE